MKLFDLIETNNNKNINIYCDMDGVLCEYDIGNFNYNTLRPIKTAINNIEKLYNNDNIKIFILSICKTNDIVNEKIKWIEKYASFLNESNCIFLSKEIFKNKESKEIKFEYLNNHLNKNDLNILIDDDINIIKYLNNNLDIKIFHVSSIID